MIAQSALFGREERVHTFGVKSVEHSYEKSPIEDFKTPFTQPF